MPTWIKRINETKPQLCDWTPPPIGMYEINFDGAIF